MAQHLLTISTLIEVLWHFALSLYMQRPEVSDSSLRFHLGPPRLFLFLRFTYFARDLPLLIHSLNCPNCWAYVRPKLGPRNFILVSAHKWQGVQILYQRAGFKVEQLELETAPV